jgi:RsiW-degrading membrane proteinase PrsW (M82 family)
MWMHLVVFTFAAALGVQVYRYDLYDKEPLRLILLTIAMGFVSMWGVGFLEDHIFHELYLGRRYPAVMAAIVSLIEDMSKVLIVLAVARAFGRHFNDPLDGLIYGTMAGLGAAVEESMLYLSLSSPTLATAGSEVVRLVSHSLMGGVLGFAIGIGIRPSGRRDPMPIVMAGCITASMTFHFLWDYIAYQQSQSVGARVGLMALLAGLMLTWGWLVRIGSHRSQLIFAPPGKTVAD